MQTTHIPSCPPPQLSFVGILSKRTAYGLIWHATYQQRACVVKMIMLTSGVHFDKNTGQYYSADKHVLDSSQIEQYFGHNDPVPFLHDDFRHRRSMTLEGFYKELDDLFRLSIINLAPQVYGYGINQSHDIHYAFIVMERIDCSLKDVYLKRELTISEEQLIHQLIDYLHQSCGLLHGDLKPSNIGVSFDMNQRIKHACFFDCQKIKYKDDYSDAEFQLMRQHELATYHKHITMNRNERH